MSEHDFDELNKLDSSSAVTQNWRASEPPPDPWSDVDGADEFGQWQFDIIGEEVDSAGRIKHEVRWDDWHRADGTKTTWESAEDSGVDFKSWTKKQSKLRHTLAEKSLEIELPSTTDIHNDATFLRSQAYNEKISRMKKTPQPNRLAEMAKLMAKHQPVTGLQALSTGPGSGSSDSPIRAPKRKSARLDSVAPSLNYASQSSSSSSKLPVQSRPAASPISHKRVKCEDQSEFRFSMPTPTIPTSSSANATSSSSVSRAVSMNSTEETPQMCRLKLPQEWTLAAKAEGASPIYIFNDVDDEPIPFVEPTFRYLERSYIFDKGIDKPDIGFLTSCTCDVCGPTPATCDCQDDSPLSNFAYTPSGLYAFNVPFNIEVIECNELCKCSVKTCINRVSQRPRDVPIQIFKTKLRGWGVRATEPVKRGKVLGIYTGRVIRRETSQALSDELSAYCFDLDGDEMVNAGSSSQSTQGKYSVDSRREGNWTRFINHSCSPNLTIYLVVHDTPTGSGMPYITFIANTYIPAYTEFTLDYHFEIAAQLAADKFSGKKKKKKRGRATIPKGSTKCLCGAADCRGYLI